MNKDKLKNQTDIMEVLQNDRTNTNNTRSIKLPPSPSSSLPASSSTTLRKSIIKISSSTTNGKIDSAEQQEKTSTKTIERQSSTQSNGISEQQQQQPRTTTRVIPVYRSISSNVNDILSDIHQHYQNQRHHSPSSHMLQHFNYKSPFNRSINFTISSPSERSSTPSFISSRTNYNNHESRAFSPKPSTSTPTSEYQCYSPSSSGYESSNMYDSSTTPNKLYSSSVANSNPSHQIIFPEFRIKEIRRTSSANRLYGGNINQQSQSTINNSSINTNSKSRSSTPTATIKPPMSKRHSFNDNTPTTMKDDLLKTLDQVEKRIAFFREIAYEMLDERSKLLDALNKICSTASTPNTFSEVDLQDIRATTDYLLYRLNGIEISIKPIRSSSQMKAFEKANQYLDDLNKILMSNEKSGKIDARKKCLSYLSSCSSDDLLDSNNNNIDEKLGAIDERFQKTIIECSLEDQKTIKKKLETFLVKIQK